MGDQYRRCSRCGATKESGFFPYAQARNCLSCAAVAATRYAELKVKSRAKRDAERKAQRAAERVAQPLKAPRALPAAKTCTKCGSTKPGAAFPPSIQTKDGTDSWCRSCHNEASRRRRQTPEGRKKAIEAKRRYRANMSPEKAEKERARLNAAKQRQDEARRHAKALALAQRLDALLFDCRAHVDEWRRQPKKPKRPQKRPWWDVGDDDLASDPRANRVKKLRRIRAIKRATPPWADKREIAKIYAAARLLTAQSGKPWHVDHAVPLRHPLVCGLHCVANLQLLPSVYNEAKGNQWSPDDA